MEMLQKPCLSDRREEVTPKGGGGLHKLIPRPKFEATHGNGVVASIINGSSIDALHEPRRLLKTLSDHTVQ